MHPSQPARHPLFPRGRWPEAQRIAAALRTETVGGAMLLAATVLALIAANGPWHRSYESLRDFTVGYAPWHLELTLAQWAADGLLALFFFIVGLELKHEFTVGDLRDPKRAALPVAAAVCGVAVPALIYLATVLLAGDRSGLAGWAIPTATDIAFALGVLAVVGTHLPSSLRTFLLTLAVADDLMAIVIIAVFLSDHIAVVPLLLSLACIAVFAFFARRRGLAKWWILVPLGVAAWAFMHASGVHATIAGVLLGLVIKILRDDEGVKTPWQPGMRRPVAMQAERWVHPLSAGLAVPVFAFFAAGVRVVGSDLTGALTDPVLIGIVLGLVAGKIIGVFGGTWLLARFTGAQLDGELAWRDVLGMSVLCGIGFTVSLLVGELSFGPGSDADEHARLGILLASTLAAVLGAVILRGRNQVYRRIAAEEARDTDADGVPDVYEEAEEPLSSGASPRDADGSSLQ